MATNKLTLKMVEEAKPKAGTKSVQFADGDGLYLLVRVENGKVFKNWRFAYRFEGVRKLRGFGVYPAVSLAEARRQRQDARDLLAQGIDPVERDREQREKVRTKAFRAAAEDNTTFRKLAQRMMDSKNITETSKQLVLQSFEKHLYDFIGDKPISQITSKELLARFREVAAEDGNQRKKTYMARKLCQWTGEVFKYANVEDENFDRNPCANIIRILPQHDEKHMRRIGRDQLGDFLVKLSEYGGYPQTRAAIWIMLYTGVRQISYRSAMWEDFDLKNAIWHRRPEKKDRDFLDLPLPTQAVNLLKELHQTSGGKPRDWVFWNPLKKENALSENAVGSALRRMKYFKYMVGHGIRGLVTTELNELGFPSRYVETQIGHKLENKVEAAYNQAKLLEPRRVMMQFFANYLDALRDGTKELIKKRAEGKEVDPLQEKALLDEAKKRALEQTPKAASLMVGDNT